MDEHTDLHFTTDHEWIKPNEKAKTIRVGISEYLVARLSDVTYVELPDPDDHHYTAGEEIGIIESLKTTSIFHAPLAGVVTGVNTALITHPEILNTDPFDKGWLFDFKPDRTSDIKNLMDADHYEASLPDDDEEE